MRRDSCDNRAGIYLRRTHALVRSLARARMNSLPVGYVYTESRERSCFPTDEGRSRNSAPAISRAHSDCSQFPITLSKSLPLHSRHILSSPTFFFIDNEANTPRCVLNVALGHRRRLPKRKLAPGRNPVSGEKTPRSRADVNSGGGFSR